VNFASHILIFVVACTVEKCKDSMAQNILDCLGLQVLIRVLTFDDVFYGGLGDETGARFTVLAGVAVHQDQHPLGKGNIHPSGCS